MNKWKQRIIGGDEEIEKRNILWNMAGSLVFSLATFLMSAAAAWFLDDKTGGILTYAYAMGQQFYSIAYFGVRAYHITDAGERFSFGDYRNMRFATSVFSVAGGVLFLLYKGYSPFKGLVVFLMICYKVVDALADVYESEFQRRGRLYITGKSNAFRTILSMSVFVLCLAATKDVVLSSVLAVAAALLGFYLFDIVILKELPAVDYRGVKSHFRILFRASLPMALSVFMEQYIMNASKYAVNRLVSDSASLYYQAIFMPTFVINLAAGFIIRPVLTKLSYSWERGRYREFKVQVLKISAVIAGLTLLALVLAYYLGTPVLGFIFKRDLSEYRRTLLFIIAGGAFNACSTLLYYILVIMRRQNHVMAVYAVGFVLALLGTDFFVEKFYLTGGALAYSLVMMVMAVLFALMAYLGWRKREYKDSEKEGQI